MRDLTQRICVGAFPAEDVASSTRAALWCAAMAFSPRRLASFLLVAAACSSPPAHPTTPAADTPAAAPAAPAPAPATGADAPSADRAFEAFAQKYLDDYFQRAPENATHAGEHRYDASWPDVSVQGEASLHK